MCENVKKKKKILRNFEIEWNKTKSVKLFLGDSLELLKKIPAESIDMIFADPPYNLSNGGFSVFNEE